MIAGEVGTEEAFEAINWGEGFPVRTVANTIIFLHWHAGPNTWAVAGAFNGWQAQEMNGQGDFWWLEVSIADPAGAQYKFVGDGEIWLADPFARAYDYDEFGEFSYVAPPALSHIQRWHGVQAGDLDRRMIRVHVPGGPGPWPVLYMHDGQNLFDPEGISGGWRMQEAVTALDTEMLLVGIDNTPDRMSEYTHADDSIDGTTYIARGEAYAELVDGVVRPHIEATYPTTGLRGLMGSSLGGLISLYIAHLYPETYHFVASLSGTLGWGRFELDGPIMQELYTREGWRDFVIYVDSGGGPGEEGCVDSNGNGLIDGRSPDNYCHNVAFAEALDEIGYTFEEDLFHWWEPDAPHNEAAWAARVNMPLGLFAAMASQ